MKILYYGLTLSFPVLTVQNGTEMFYQSASLRQKHKMSTTGFISTIVYVYYFYYRVGKPAISANNNMVIAAYNNIAHTANKKMGLAYGVLHRLNNQMIEIGKKRSAPSFHGSACTKHTPYLNLSPIIKTSYTSQPSSIVPCVHPA